MKPRPKPLLGLLLGLLLGVAAVGLLWQLGIAPPDRFILFGVVAVAIALTELLLTQTTRRGKKRFVTSMIIAGVFGGIALTGIPQTFMDSGSLSDGCTLEATSSMEEVTPTDTSAFDPFDVTPTDTIEWTSSTDQVLTDWDSGLGMYIGGFEVPVFTAERDNSEQSQSWYGSEDVAEYLAQLEDDWGFTIRGTYHVYGYIHADEGDCDMAGYIRINAENPFATPLIITLWIVGGLMLVIIIALTVSVRRSIRESKAFAAHAVNTAGGVLPEDAPPSQPDAAVTPVVPVAEPPVAQPAVAEPPVAEPAVAEPAVAEPEPPAPASDTTAPEPPTAPEPQEPPTT